MEGFKPTRTEKPEEVLKNKERRAIEELKQPISEITKELLPELVNGEYSIIIGEDSSGRIPTRIVGRIAQEFYRLSDIEPPLVRYVAGSSGLTDVKREVKLEKLKEQFQKMRDTLTKEGRKTGRILIVTEAMSHGSSMQLFTEALKELDWPVDIASVGVEASDPEYRRNYLQEKLGTRIVYGMKGTPKVYTKAKALSGVRKRPEELFAKPDVRALWRLHWPASVETQRAARDLADQAAYQIVGALIDEIPLVGDRLVA